MASRMLMGAGLALALVGPALAADDSRPPATLSITLDGTAGPILQGSDPLGLNGQSATVTLLIDEGAKPKSQKKNSVTYKIPAGAITLTFGGTQYQTTSPAKMIIKLGRTADTLTLVSAVTQQGITVNFTDTTVLAPGSWTDAVLTHPAPFQPSPQDFSEPASKLKYSSSLFGTTVVGVSGTAASSDAMDPVLPDDGE